MLLLNVCLSKVWPVVFFEAGELREDVLGQLFKNLGSSIFGFWSGRFSVTTIMFSYFQLAGNSVHWSDLLFEFFSFLCILAFFVVVFTFLYCKSSMPFLALGSHIAVILIIVV